MRFSAIAATILFLSLIFVSCNQGSHQPTAQMAPQVEPAKRYHLTGRVVGIDPRAKMADIDADAIPGFMEAMTMPYQVKPPDELTKLSAGDRITADVVVQNDAAWLENIQVRTHPPGRGPQ